jgi:hypothetical protein
MRRGAASLHCRALQICYSYDPDSSHILWPHASSKLRLLEQIFQQLSNIASELFLIILHRSIKRRVGEPARSSSLPTLGDSSNLHFVLVDLTPSLRLAKKLRHSHRISTG